MSEPIQGYRNPLPQFEWRTLGTGRSEPVQNDYDDVPPVTEVPPEECWCGEWKPDCIDCEPEAA